MAETASGGGSEDICGSLDHVEGQRIAIGREGREAGAVYSYLRASDAAAPHCHRAAYSGLDAGFLDGVATIGPVNIYSVTANSFQALDLTRAPCRRESRQKVDAPSVALKQHLRHTGSGAKVAVYLEGSVRIVEIIVDSAFILVYVIGGGVAQGIAQYFVGMVAVESACPVIDLPSHRPSCRGVAAEFERVNSGSKPWAVDIDLIERIEGHEMRCVAMAFSPAV